MLIQATYIWMDGAKPTQKLRCKLRVFEHDDISPNISDFPLWGFDGSSTYQACGNDSDLILQPVCAVKNPLDLQDQHYLVMCEVLNPDGSAHSSNTRAKLRELCEQYQKDCACWIGFEQEYTLFKGQRPLGWPEAGYPAPQGPFYCGVGADEVFGRPIVEAHTQACLDAGLMLYGTNAEVMPGQWEFQIGYRGVKAESADPLTVCDHLWLARWLLYRIGEDFKVSATLDPKPVKGDWNGAGMHTNFSTKMMRDSQQGMAAIEAAIAALSGKHLHHIKDYGFALEERLTGEHETAHIKKFSSGVSDRGSSIRIPRNVALQGYGYLEDRRPGANADPYIVAGLLVESVCSPVKESNHAH